MKESNIIIASRIAKINTNAVVARNALFNLREENRVLEGRSNMSMLNDEERNVISETILLLERLDQKTAMHLIEKIL